MNEIHHRFCLAALIIFIVLAGAALRLWQIGNKSLWSDELFSAGIITSKYLVPLEGADIFRRTNIFNIQDIDTFWTVKAADQSPPLFEFIGKIFTSVVGANEISIRLPSALASIFLLLFLAQECWKENNTKNSTIFFFTLLPTAFSAILIEYAQEGRAYSLGILFSAILIIQYYKRILIGFRKATLPQWKEIIVFILACYTHYNNIILSGIFLTIYFWQAISRKDKKSALKIIIIPLAILPWIVLSFHTLLFTSQGGAGWSKDMSLLDAIIKAIQTFPQIFGNYFLLIAIAILVIAMIFRRFAKNTNAEKINSNGFFGKEIFFLACIAAIYIFCVSIVAAKSEIFHYRHFLFIAPLVYLVVAIFLQQLSHTRWWIGVIAAFFLMGTQASSLDLFYKTAKEGYREAAHELLGRLGDNSVIVTTWAPNRDYYGFYLRNNKKGIIQLSLSQPEEAQALCEKLAPRNEFGVIAHTGHQNLTDSLKVSCGSAVQRFSGSAVQRFSGSAVQRFRIPYHRVQVHRHYRSTLAKNQVTE